MMPNTFLLSIYPPFHLHLNPFFLARLVALFHPSFLLPSFPFSLPPPSFICYFLPFSFFLLFLLPLFLPSISLLVPYLFFLPSFHLPPCPPLPVSLPSSNNISGWTQTHTHTPDSVLLCRVWSRWSRTRSCYKIVPPTCNLREKKRDGVINMS